jgi:hypothetical protein
MAERYFAAVLMLLFGCFFYIAASDILQLIERHALGDGLLLLYCAIVCLGWIVFLGALSLAGQPVEHGLAEKPREAWVKD